MTTASALDPAQRQVLINLGDRYVVFGPFPGLREPVRFSPETDSDVLPRVADAGQGDEARIAHTLRVAGMKRRATPTERIEDGDVALLDDDGNRVLIDIKVRQRDPNGRDFDHALQRLTDATSRGLTLEVWFFNIERLNLVIARLDRLRLQIDRLTPLDVWERTAEGVFNRARVVEQADDWVHRIGTLYDDVRAWLGDRPNLRCEQSRTVTMSEEIMQRYAVTDREIPVLDVLDADQVVASFVPRGLWLIGSWGRIDVITRDRTHVLLALGGQGNLSWRLVTSPDDRRQTVPFDKSALLALVS